jgi:hypothetical protein
MRNKEGPMSELVLGTRPSVSELSLWLRIIVSIIWEALGVFFGEGSRD